jgi:hypothetical protein
MIKEQQAEAYVIILKYGVNKFYVLASLLAYVSISQSQFSNSLNKEI